MLFHLRHWTNTAVKLGKFGLLLYRINRIRRRVLAEHERQPYTDVAIRKLARESEAQLELMHARPPHAEHAHAHAEAAD